VLRGDLYISGTEKQIELPPISAICLKTSGSRVVSVALGHGLHCLDNSTVRKTCKIHSEISSLDPAYEEIRQTLPAAAAYPSIKKKATTFCTGPAGTGKTFWQLL